MSHISVIALAIVSIAVTTCRALPDIHTQMSAHQLQSVFHVESPDAVPHYEVVKLLHDTSKEGIVPQINNYRRRKRSIDSATGSQTKNHVKKDLSKTPYYSEGKKSSKAHANSLYDNTKLKSIKHIKEHKVKFDAFGKKLNLKLKKTQGLFKRDELHKLPMWFMDKEANNTHGVNLEKIEDELSHSSEHIGEVYQDEENMAAILMRRHEITGDLIMEGNIGHDLVIKPLPHDLSPNPEESHHVIYKRAADAMEHLSDFAYMEPDDMATHEKLEKLQERRKRSAHRNTLADLEMEQERLEREDDLFADESSGHRRAKRQAPYMIYPEILVIVDFDGYRLHGGDNLQVKRYFIAFWNGVDLRYRLLKEPKIRVSIAGIIISRGRDATPYLERNRVGRDAIDSAAALTDMGKYLFRERRLPVYDIAVAITKYDMCRRRKGGRCTKGTAGFAYVGGACVVNRRLEKVNSVAIIEDTGGFSGIIVAAHEVGHLLGAVHDGSPPPSYLGGPGAQRCRWEDGFIMSDLRHTERGFRWSACSVQSFQHFLNGATATCLYNVPHEDNALGRSLPGTLLSLDAQCRRDRGTYACFKDERVCAQLFCFDAQTGYCVAYRPAAEGSTCGNNLHCLDGRCAPLQVASNLISNYGPNYRLGFNSNENGNDDDEDDDEENDSNAKESKNIMSKEDNNYNNDNKDDDNDDDDEDDDDDDNMDNDNENNDDDDNDNEDEVEDVEQNEKILRKIGSDSEEVDNRNEEENNNNDDDKENDNDNDDENDNDNNNDNDDDDNEDDGDIDDAEDGDDISPIEDHNNEENSSSSSRDKDLPTPSPFSVNTENDDDEIYLTDDNNQQSLPKELNKLYDYNRLDKPNDDNHYEETIDNDDTEKSLLFNFNTYQYLTQLWQKLHVTTTTSTTTTSTTTTTTTKSPLTQIHTKQPQDFRLVNRNYQSYGGLKLMAKTPNQNQNRNLGNFQKPASALLQQPQSQSPHQHHVHTKPKHLTNTTPKTNKQLQQQQTTPTPTAPSLLSSQSSTFLKTLRKQFQYYMKLLQASSVNSRSTSSPRYSATTLYNHNNYNSHNVLPPPTPLSKTSSSNSLLNNAATKHLHNNKPPPANNNNLNNNNNNHHPQNNEADNEQDNEDNEDDNNDDEDDDDDSGDDNDESNETIEKQKRKLTIPKSTSTTTSTTNTATHSKSVVQSQQQQHLQLLATPPNPSTNSQASSPTALGLTASTPLPAYGVKSSVAYSTRTLTNPSIYDSYVKKIKAINDQTLTALNAPTITTTEVTPYPTEDVYTRTLDKTENSPPTTISQYEPNSAYHVKRTLSGSSGSISSSSGSSGSSPTSTSFSSVSNKNPYTKTLKSTVAGHQAAAHATKTNTNNGSSSSSNSYKHLTNPLRIQIPETDIQKTTPSQQTSPSYVTNYIGDNTQRLAAVVKQNEPQQQETQQQSEPQQQQQHLYGNSHHQQQQHYVTPVHTQRQQQQQSHTAAINYSSSSPSSTRRPKIKTQKLIRRLRTQIK